MINECLVEGSSIYAANYANEMAAKLVAVQAMNDVTVNDLAIVFAVVDQMKKNREKP